MINTDTNTIPSWINGQPNDELPIADRGLAYGDGVFETVRVNEQGPVLLSYHLERLQLGLKRLRIPVDWHALEQEIRRYPGWMQSGVVKLQLTRGSGGRGYSTADVQGPNRIFSSHPIPQYPVENARDGIHLFPCTTRLATNPVLAGIKHLNRLEQVLARQEWSGDDYQEGLLLDFHGHVIEGVFSNLFVVRQGRVMAPSLDGCGVEGVMRRWLLEQFKLHDIQVQIGRVALRDIQLADEWFFCNSVYGVWPVRQFEHRAWQVGDTTRRVQQWVSDHWHI